MPTLLIIYEKHPTFFANKFNFILHGLELLALKLLSHHCCLRLYRVRTAVSPQPRMESPPNESGSTYAMVDEIRPLRHLLSDVRQFLPQRLSHVVDVAPDDLVLIGFVEFAEISAPAPDAHHKILVQFRMELGIAQRIHI